MFLYLKLGIIAFIAVRGSTGQETCLTASGTQGTCISIVECSPLLNLLQRSDTLPVSETGALKNSFCGVVETIPKVCCPRNNLEAKPTPPRIGLVPDPPDVTNHPKLRLINNANCGPITEGKIILGNKTTVLEFPWMALIGYKVNGQGIDFQCGGTVINKRYVLTAGHCVTGLRSDLELAAVRIGEHDLSKERDCDEENGKQIYCADKYQDFAIESFTAHSNYHPSGQQDDIALIRLNKDADFTSLNVRPICLPVGDLATVKFDQAVVTGWGRTESGIRSQDLLKVRLGIMPNEECSRIFEINRIQIGYKQLCAGGKNKDSCAGDSGGPMQFPGNINNEPKFIQFGVVSFGTKKCGVEGYPGVYTKVVYYMDWILNTITE